MPEPTPQQRLHANEQLSGFLREVAQQAAVYFGELTRQGFTRDEALQLTVTMQEKGE
ncbi:MAG TPA: hypothetical protein VEB59_08820 [Gemmatimonadales bacterium]|nr:hypothetical protein [Gemmatimonadales bacterium]